MIFANGRLLPDSQLSQVLEELDSSENYRGTSLEGLDAFQRQLKRYHIKVSGPGSDQVEQFFASAGSAALYTLARLRFISHLR